MGKLNNRNITLDLLKLLASYMVVFIHFNFYGNFGIVVDAIARFAVPLFFMSSGFFCYNNSPYKIKQKAVRILKMFLLATILYHLFNIIILVLEGEAGGIASYLVSLFSLKTIVEFVFLNVTSSSTHLWFLLALVYIYIMQYFVVKYKIKDRLVFLFSCVALSIHLFADEFLPMFGVEVEVVPTFLLIGFPFFTFGLLMKKNESKLKNINNSVLIVLMILGVVEIVFSRLAFTLNEVYLGTIPFVFALLVIAIKYPEIKCSGFLLTLCACSTDIYIYHRVIGRVITKGLKMAGVDTTIALYNNLITIAICIASTVFALILLKSIHLVNAKLSCKNRKT